MNECPCCGHSKVWWSPYWKIWNLKVSRDHKTLEINYCPFCGQKLEELNV